MSAAAVDLAEVLAPVRRRLGLAAVGEWALRGAAAGALLAALEMAVGRLAGADWRLPVAVALVVIGAVIGAVLGARRWPNTDDAARAVDRHFALRDRVTTAWERRDASDPVSGLQRADAARRLTGLAVQEGASARVPRREAAVLVAGLLVAGGLLFTGSPGTHALSTPIGKGDHGRTVAAAAKLPQIVRKANAGLPPDIKRNAAMRKLNATLARLKQQLLHSPNKAASLLAISKAQAQLKRLSSNLHPISSHAIKNLNQSLKQSVPQSMRAKASASDKQALAAAVKALQHLASQISHMSAAQKAALAKSLAKAANSTPDSTLRSALHSAASSLAYNDPQAAAQSLRAAAQAAQQSPAQSAAKSRLNAAQSGLEGAKSDVTGLGAQAGTGKQPSSSAPGQGQGKQSSGKGQGTGKGNGKGSGKGQGQGQGKGQGQGQGKGQGQGTGQGRGKGQGQGQGKGQGQSSGKGNSQGSGGRGGTGGHGTGGGRGGPGNHGTGKSGARVFVPSRQLNGRTITRTGPNGAPLPGASVPYQQVVGQYAQSAHQALDRSSLPPDLRSYVQNYFSSISGS